jgi:hypothetical protein
MGDTNFLSGTPTTTTDYDAPPAAQQPAPGTAPTTPTPGAAPTGTDQPGTTPPDATDPAAGMQAPMPAAGAAAPPPANTGDTPPVGTEDPANPTAPDPTMAEPDPPASTGSAGTLTVSLTSKAVGGRYAPQNIGAIWVETGSGQFVKTLVRWAGIRAGDLRSWNAASGGWGFSFFGLGGGGGVDEADAVTGATLRSHQMHSVTWDMIDNNEQLVPDGAYVVKVEVADGREEVGSIEFQKGSAPVDASPSGGPWTSLTLSYQP